MNGNQNNGFNNNFNNFNSFNGDNNAQNNEDTTNVGGVVEPNPNNGNGTAPQGDYYNNESYYSNDNYNGNYSDTSYEEPKQGNGLWWKILLGILLLLIVIIIILKFATGGKSSDQKYTELKETLCNAAETYVGQNPTLIDNTKPGVSVAIKLRKLSDASLVGEKIENPYYSGSIFKKSTVDKYYSLDNSIRLTVLTDGSYSCEMVDNSTDVTAPELRLSGDAEIELAVGSEFEDPGYTATDDYDGDITTNVTRSGNVDTTKAGEYTITYTVTDTAGNVTTKTRKVVVSEYADIDITLGTLLDKVTPMISLKGSNPYCLVKGQSYTEPGAIATDNVDGTITDKIAVTNKVTGNLMGAFRIVYKVEDTSGNQAIAYRAVIVTTECPEEQDDDLVANNAPVITLVGKSAVTIQKGTQYLDLGATAYDKEDGDLTSQIITDTTLVDVNTAGVYRVSYRVTDSSGTLATAIRTVTVKQSVSGKPSVRFTTSKSNITTYVGEGTNKLIAAPKAVNESGVAVSVTTEIFDYETKQELSAIDWNSVGKYKVVYTATHGNGTLTQTKPIYVTILSNGVTIGGPDEITISRRDLNCDILEADLRAGGITFSSGTTKEPLISVVSTDRAACMIGTYDATIYASTSEKDAVTRKIKVKVVEGNGTVDVTAPSKVIITSNTANSADAYNSVGKWVGRDITAITINFTATPKSGTTISYYEYSENCNASSGKANKTGDTTGTLTWTKEGNKSVCIRAVTTVGARGPWSNPVKLYLDNTGPVVAFTHTWADGSDDWHNSYSLQLSYAATDENGVGLDHFEYTYDDVKAKEDQNIDKIPEGTGRLTVYEDTESVRPSLFVYVRAVDKAGNFGPWIANPAYANIDTVKPNAPTLTVSGNGESVVKITATFTDGTSVRPSGFGKLVYTVDGGTELTEPTKTITAPFNRTAANVNNLIKVWNVDKAGNRSDGSAETTVNVAPAKVAVTGITLKNGNTEIADGSSCSAGTIYAGSSFTLTATPIPTDADDKVAAWSSSNTTVATVNSTTGAVSVKNVGSTVITVKIGGISKVCKIDAKASGGGGGGGGSNCTYATEATCETATGANCWLSGSCWIELDDSEYPSLAVCQSAAQAMKCSAGYGPSCVKDGNEYDLKCVAGAAPNTSDTYSCYVPADHFFTCTTSGVSTPYWKFIDTKSGQSTCSAYQNDRNKVVCTQTGPSLWQKTTYEKAYKYACANSTYTYTAITNTCWKNVSTKAECGSSSVKETTTCDESGGTMVGDKCWLYKQTTEKQGWTCLVG